METTGSVAAADGTALAFAHLAGTGPTIVFLPGFGSDMQGTKALALRAACAAAGRPLLRFDYRGHGTSGGRFDRGTIGLWLADALDVIRARTDRRLVLVGSSMGGWIALLAARALGHRVAGLVGIAAAPDFTETLVWNAMSFAERRTLLELGEIRHPGQYGAELIITRALIEDGRDHLVLGGPIPVAGPVRLLHGQQDAEVPWETALAIAERVTAQDVRVILVKDGDHRLSRPQDLDLLTATVAELAT
jgi:pimeloyl-ACP methyl ester carboxylesterase